MRDDVGDGLDRCKVMAAAALAVLVGDLISARRWSVRAADLAREELEKIEERDR